MYGGSLTLISALGLLQEGASDPRRSGSSTIAFTAALSLVVARLASSESFLANFENFLLLVLYFFIPWTAVNLVDYFIVRKGHYAIAEIFKPDGIYGRWGWRGIVSYLVGFVAMMPFFSTGLYSGWVANAAHGARLLAVHRPAGLRASSTGGCAARSTSRPRRGSPSEQADELEREAMVHERPEG